MDTSRARRTSRTISFKFENPVAFAVVAPVAAQMWHVMMRKH